MLGREAERVSRRNVPATVDDAVHERGIERHDGVTVAAGELRRDLDAHGTVERDYARGLGDVPLELPEVVLTVLVDVERGQELGVEVPRREAERIAAVALDDDADVRRAGVLDRTPHAGGPMVVGGDGEGPLVVE